MKIRLLKDLPKHKTGSIHENDSLVYGFQMLIDTGFAEEIKDDIDIEKIRREVNNSPYQGDIVAFTLAYFTVKAVIEKLNGDWKPIFGRQEDISHYIVYDANSDIFEAPFTFWNKGILPNIKSFDIATKVMAICETELRVFFGAK